MSHPASLRFDRIPYITLWAVKFDEIVKLYRDTLGLTVVDQNPGFIMFDTKGMRLAFHKLEKAPPLRSHTVELHLEVPDVDSAYEMLKAKGIVFEHEQINRP